MMWLGLFICTSIPLCCFGGMVCLFKYKPSAYTHILSCCDTTKHQLRDRINTDRANRQDDSCCSITGSLALLILYYTIAILLEFENNVVLFYYTRRIKENTRELKAISGSKSTRDTRENESGNEDQDEETETRSES